MISNVNNYMYHAFWKRPIWCRNNIQDLSISMFVHRNYIIALYIFSSYIWIDSKVNLLCIQVNNTDISIIRLHLILWRPRALDTLVLVRPFRLYAFISPVGTLDYMLPFCMVVNLRKRFWNGETKLFHFSVIHFNVHINPLSFVFFSVTVTWQSN